jgi:hypothetical protein
MGERDVGGGKEVLPPQPLASLFMHPGRYVGAYLLLQGQGLSCKVPDDGATSVRLSLTVAGSPTLLPR